MLTTLTQRLKQISAGPAVTPGRWHAAPSTRVRILGWYLVLLAGALALGLFLQRSILLNQLSADVNAQLRQEVEEIEQLSSGRDPATGEPFAGDVRAIFDTFLRRNVPVESEALFTLVEGEPYSSTVTPLQLLDNPAVVAEWAAIQTTTRDELDTGEGKVRYLAVPLSSESGPSGVFVVAIFLDERRARVNEVVRIGAIVYGSIFLGASALAWLTAGRVLRPIRLLTDTAQSITDENWSERIPVRGDDEIAELTGTFNDMLDRLESSFGTQRRFIDDAGHELRTPITIIRGHLELLGTEQAERDETIRLVLDELDGMTRIVEDLLFLARAEQPDFLDLHPLDVGELTEETAAKAAALASGEWVIAEAAQVVMTGDRQRLTQALMNLARNAAEHSDEGSTITIGSRTQGGNVHFWVRDAGEGIPLADQGVIFERFSRDRSGKRRMDGAGLGLAIVKAIAEAHGGRVLLESSVGIGSTFTLILPLEGPAGDVG